MAVPALGLSRGLYVHIRLHFLIYLGADQSFNLSATRKDIVQRPFITVGFAGSGGKRWQQLRRPIHICAIRAVIHYYWLAKSGIRLPLFYGIFVGIFLLLAPCEFVHQTRQAIRPQKSKLRS